MEDGTAVEVNRRSRPSLWPPLSCSLSSLLTMNCRAKAQGLARRLRMGVMKSEEKHNRSASIDETQTSHKNTESELFGLHIVTSEPTINMPYSSLKDTKLDTEEEEDSDQYYDFDMDSLEEPVSCEKDIENQSVNKRQPLPNRNITKWHEKSFSSSEKPESGCVTSVTSPVSSRPDNEDCELLNSSIDWENLSAVSKRLYSANVSCDLDPSNLKSEWCVDKTETSDAPNNAENNERKTNRLSMSDSISDYECEENCYNRRRSFEINTKKYLLTSLSSPPGYVSDNFYGNANLAKAKQTTLTFSFHDKENVFMKRESCVVFNETRDTIKTQLDEKVSPTNNVSSHCVTDKLPNITSPDKTAGFSYINEDELKKAWLRDRETLAGGASNIWHSVCEDELLHCKQEAGNSAYVSGAPVTYPVTGKSAFSSDSREVGSEVVKVASEMRDELENPKLDLSNDVKVKEGHLMSNDLNNACMNTESSSILKNEGQKSAESTPGPYESSRSSSPVKQADLSRLLEEADISVGLSDNSPSTDRYDNEADEEDCDDEEFINSKFSKTFNFKECMQRSISDEEISIEIENLPESNSAKNEIEEGAISCETSSKIVIERGESEDGTDDAVSEGNLLNVLSQIKLGDETIKFKDDLPEEEDESEFKQRIKRSSSLKSGKTPPGTPGSLAQKKNIKFADALGLELVQWKFFQDKIPDIPKAAYKDLILPPEEDFNFRPQFQNHLLPSKRLTPIFQQPCALHGFIERVRDEKVSLDNVVVDNNMIITGEVKVLNLSYHKRVIIRYTCNDWKTHFDTVAMHMPNSCDGFSDKFKFHIAANTLQDHESLVFCICYTACGVDYWDNNRGANYRVQCYCTGPQPHNFQMTFGRVNDSPPTTPSLSSGFF